MAEDPAVRTAAYNAGGYCTKTHNIPVEHFEYSYIEKCNNVKELEKILLALRSGEEGVFPHLEQQCENKLRNLHPESRVLREVKPIGTLKDLSKEEQIELKDDLSDWLQQMKTTDTKLKTETGILGDEKLPPPRAVNTKTNEAKVANKSNKSNKRVKPRDYKEWDKVDIDAELEKIDKQPEEIKAKSVNKPKSGKLVDTLDPTSLTQAEKELKASREKDKGNEAFRSADYQEAVTYYSRSLSLCPSAASYNNRAIAYVKLCKWKKAIEDCDQVLQLEPGNIKAYFRRALANKGCKDFQAAKEDLEQVLTVEPQNKKAQELLQQVEEELTKVKDKPKGRRLEIEEVGSSDSEGEEEEEETKENEEVCSDENDGSKSSKLVNGLSSHDSKTVENNDNIDQTGNCTASDIWGEGEIENNAESSSSVISAKPESDKQDETNPSLNEKVDIANKTVDLVMEKTDKTVTVDPPSEVTSDNPVQEAPKPRVVLLPVLPAKVLELKEEGNALYKAGQYGEAIEKYTKAVDILLTMPDHYGNLSTIYSNRAACKSKIGDCSGCIKDCDRALELVPHSIKPILRRAAAYEASERFRQAYVDFKYALGIDSSIHSAHQGADRCRHMLQREDGVRWREKLPPIPSVLAYEIPVFTSDNSAIPSTGVTTAATSSATGDRNESEADNGGSQRRPSDEERFFKLKAQGNEDVQKGNFKRAIESYTQCISLYPGRAVSYTNRALCYLRLNQPAKANEDCSKAVQLEERNVKALFRRAQARKMLKQYKDSIADLTKLLKIDPKNSAAKKELEVVKNYWREELQSMKSPSTSTTVSKAGKKPKETKDIKKQQASKPQEQRQRKRLLIQEVDSSSEEEEEKTGAEVKSPAPATKVTEEASKLKDNKENQISQSEQTSETPPVKTSMEDTKAGGEEKEETQSSPSKVSNSASKPASKKCTKSATIPTSTGLPSTPPSTPSTPSTPKLTKVTPYEFMSAWNSLKTSTGIMPYAELLAQIEPQDLPKVLSNKLESSMLDIIVKCIHQHFAETDPNKAYGFLDHICKVPRFEMLTMFLSAEEKRGLKEVFSKLHKHTCVGYTDQQIQKLQKKYGI